LVVLVAGIFLLERDISSIFEANRFEIIRLLKMIRLLINRDMRIMFVLDRFRMDIWNRLIIMISILLELILVLIWIANRFLVIGLGMIVIVV